jgi:hypothetical protein
LFIFRNPQDQGSHSGKHGDTNKYCPDDKMYYTYFENSSSLVSHKITGKAKSTLIAEEKLTYKIVGLIS